MNDMFTFQCKLLQLYPLINVVYTTFNIVYYTFVGNRPIVIKGSLVIWL